MSASILNCMWVIVCAGLVFSMQAGFLCLESGLTRGKNSINVAIKNLTDVSVSILLFWALGFAVMFGASHGGWIGVSGFFPPLGQSSLELSSFFLFQAMFCATAPTIVSGAVAERMKFAAYLVVVVIVSGLVYPLFGHWAWGGAISGEHGWLAELGFVDFAGSTVVHGIGGWSALAAVLVIGPRAGRFNADSVKARIPASNLPLAMLGALLLWMGWIGFNGGSTLAMNHQVGGIVCNTCLAAAAGMTTGTAMGWWFKGHPEATAAINGSLAGLVAITAGCHAVTSLSAIAIGAIGAIVMMAAQWTLERLRIDDAIAAFPVHGVAGLWGTIAVALFGLPEVLGTGLSRWSQFLVQVTGALTATVFAGGTSYVLLKAVHRVVSLRVTPEQELLGLNIVEHNATTETSELLGEMETQRVTGDFSRRVTVEPFTEVGQIAEQYNGVLDRVVQESERSRALAAEREDVQRQLIDSARQAGMAEVATGVLHNVGNVLNSVNVSATMLQKRLESSRVVSLVKAAEVICEHQHDLAAFLKSDPRGQNFPRLLERLAANLAEEKDAELLELRSLLDNIQHMKETIKIQQDSAAVRGDAELVDSVELLEHALRINSGGLVANNIRVVRQLDDLPPIMTQKHKVLQILVNLVSNAKNSLAEFDGDDRTLTVTVSADHGNARIEVRDNGGGISKANLSRLFTHGFTTRKEGHGFGLHASSVAANELGGSILAESDGPGLGAVFTLRLPFEQFDDSHYPTPESTCVAQSLSGSVS